MQRFHVGVIFRFRQDARDHPALVCNPQATLGAQRFKIDWMVQDRFR